MKKILVLLAFSLLFFSCKKETKCETWKYYDQCTPKNSSVYACGTDPVQTTKFCGHELDGVYAGATKTIHEDENVKEVRHFIEMVKQ